MARTKRTDPGKMLGVQWIDGYDPTRDHRSFGKRIPSYLRRLLAIGPGGPGCACCFVAPGKDRKAVIRAMKRKERRLALCDAVKDMEDN